MSSILSIQANPRVRQADVFSIISTVQLHLQADASCPLERQFFSEQYLCSSIYMYLLELLHVHTYGLGFFFVLVQTRAVVHPDSTGRTVATSKQTAQRERAPRPVRVFFRASRPVARMRRRGADGRGPRHQWTGRTSVPGADRRTNTRDKGGRCRPTRPDTVRLQRSDRSSGLLPADGPGRDGETRVVPSWSGGFCPCPNPRVWR